MSDPNIDTAREVQGKSASSFGRLIPLGILIVGLIAFFALGLDDVLSFETLKQNRDVLSAWVTEYGVIAILIFMIAYILVVAFSLPGGAVMTIAGGFLFGWIAASIAIVIAATIGATLLFLAAKTALGDSLRARAGKSIQKMEAGFRENAFHYLLVLRLIPIFPFFLVNLVPAFLGVTLRTYVIATFIGIIPGTAVYASVGNGLGEIFDRGETPNLGIIFEPSILGPILGLAVLALLPVLYKKFMQKTPSNPS